MANRAFPYPNAPVAIVQMEPGAREEAKRAISFMRPVGRHGDEHLAAAGRRDLRRGPAGGPEARDPAHRRPQRVGAARASCRRRSAPSPGHFQCDARGVGASWEVAELREIATALLGTVDLIRNPADIAADFAALVDESMSKGVADAELRVWAPQGAQVLFVRRVAPTVEDLTARRTEVNALTGAYPTGRVGRRVPRLPRGRPGGVQAGGLGAARGARADRGRRRRAGVRAWSRRAWSDDSALTARINPEVAHYTGQAELASAIQEGLAAKAAGDEATATVKLGRAVQLAAETGNEEATSRLRRVVEIDDEETGHRPAQAEHRQARRDGARHGLDQDHPGPPVSTVTCPNGHPSTSTDYCDVCGSPIEAAVVVGGARARCRRRGGGDRRARTAGRPPPRSRCSARSAATTSRRGPRRPRSRHRPR